MIELKPCPFCGRKAYSDVSVRRGATYDGIVATVRCENCCASQSSAMQSGGNIEALQEVCMRAVKAWNDRTPCWIPCSEKVPDDDIEVLVCDDGDCVIARYDSKSTAYTSGWSESRECIPLNNVTHWMPLPEGGSP